VTPDDRACLALDLGGATTAISLLGRVDGRWRLLGGSSAPAATPVDALVATLVKRLAAADVALARDLDVAGAEHWPRLVARTGRPPRIVVLAATERTLARLDGAARRAGWAVTAASAETTDPLAMTRLLLRREVGTVLVGASDPAANDERSLIGDLAELVAAAVGRRPGMTVVLAGGLADYADRFGPTPSAAETVPLGPDDAVDGPRDAFAAGPNAEPSAGPGVATVVAAPGDGGGLAAAGDPVGGGDPVVAATPTMLLAPSPIAGDPPGEALRTLLDELRCAADDGRRAIARATETLAAHLGRRVETLEVGQDGALRAVAWPAGATGRTGLRWATVGEAALIPDPVGDDTVDGVLGWSTLTLDRYRLRDRLAELRLTPWAEAHGDGAPLRLAAARAALDRLVSLTPELDRPVPDLVVVAGGVWAVAPGAAVALAVADALRRPGASQLALDHARLLGPLGTVTDDALRLAMVADLADDLLAPLGTVVIPAGLRAGRSAGRLVVHAAAGTTEMELVPGGLELVDLPPGESAVAEFRFRDAVRLGTRGKHFTIDVAGGLGGLLVDLRDIPLHLPERADRRRELLAAWQRALWIGLEA